MTLELRRPPALTTGLPIFLFLFYLSSFHFNSVESLSLGRQDILHPSFDLLNRLSFYTVVHLNWFHLLANLISIVPLLWEIESQVGTVRTGIILNVLSVFPGLAYLAVSLLIASDTRILGCSGWVFSFLGYSSWNHYLETPVLPVEALHVQLPFQVPTWSYPIAVLFLIAIILPASSFLGHAIGLAFGYLLAMGYLGFAIDGTSAVVGWIEERIEVVITGLGRIVVWYKEHEIRPLDEGHVLGV